MGARLGYEATRLQSAGDVRRAARAVSATFARACVPCARQANAHFVVVVAIPVYLSGCAAGVAGGYSASLQVSCDGFVSDWWSVFLFF